MSQKSKTALIVGATGVIGRSMLQHLTQLGEWNVIATSRRKPDIDADFEHVAVDLSDPVDARAKLGELDQITHIFFSAYVEKESWAEMVTPNVALLKNVMDAVEPAAQMLEHVNLMQGTKWYGSHLGPFKTPARESDPRHMPPNFYYDQQDFIVERQRSASWTWSAARPHSTCGFATGNPMNLVMVIAVYATISKALGLPLRHPGSEINSHALYNVCDTGLLSRACTWMATDPAAANEEFNVTNGDVFRWRDMWPIFADYFGMEVAQPQEIDLVQMMTDKASLWEQLSNDHDLQVIPYDQLVGWNFGNFVFAPKFDIISSTMKLKQFGFHEVQDSGDMFLRHFDELRAARIIP